jgi:hypothetical protein
MWPVNGIQQHFLQRLKVSPKFRRVDPLQFYHLSSSDEKNGRSCLRVFKQFIKAGGSFTQLYRFHLISFGLSRSQFKPEIRLVLYAR